MSRRIFFALWPTAESAAEIALQTAACSWPEGARRYPAADLHLTLHFLGDCEEDLLGQLTAMPAEPVEPFTLLIDELALWTGGILVALPSKPPSALIDLHARIARGLHELGVLTESRAFRPHVTTARRTSVLPADLRWRPVEWRVADYMLAASTGDPQRRYEILRGYRGAGAGAPGAGS